MHPATIDELRLLHDTDLRNVDSDDARAVLAGRARAARQLRLLLARVYGVDGKATARQWHVQPYLTDTGTVGIVDIAHGTAWDIGVAADPGVEDLGLGEPNSAYAAANVGAGGGDVRFDGQLMQRDGTTVVSGQVVPPTVPAGWRQIELPTWRGYDDTNHYTEVPVAAYAPEHWIRPRLVATGLMTCYGTTGDPAHGECLDRTSGWGAAWPHGVPEWVEGRSVTVLDAIANTINYLHPGASLPCAGLPRGTDAEEMDRLAPTLAAARDDVARSLRQWLEAYPDDAVAHLAQKLQCREAATSEASAVVATLHQRVPPGADAHRQRENAYRLGRQVSALARADTAVREAAAGYPWVAAMALARADMGARPDLWPMPATSC